MRIEDVRRRYDAANAVSGRELDFLTNNGRAYIAHKSPSIARSIGPKPINALVSSPQSNGMPESLVNIFNRDCVSSTDMHDERTVLEQLSCAFKHFNEIRPHSSL